MKSLLIISVSFLLILNSCKKEALPVETNTISVERSEQGLPVPTPLYRWTLLPSLFPNIYPYGDWNAGNLVMPVGNDIYMLGGSLIEYIYKYNRAAQKFEVHTEGSYTVFSVGHHYLFSSANKIYGGLRNDDSDTSFFFAIDPVSGVLEHKKRFPGIRTGNPLSFSIGNKGYVISGFNSTIKSQVWEYDFATDNWTNKGASPLGNRVGAVAFVADNKVYLGLGYETIKINGQNVNLYKKDWISYTPGYAYAAVKANFPGPDRINGYGYVLNGQIYVGLGQNYSTQVRYKDLWKFSPATNTWKQEKDWPGVYNDDDGWYGGTDNNVSLFTDGVAGYAVKGACNQLWRYSNSSLIIQ